MTTTCRGLPIRADAKILGPSWGHLKDTPKPAAPKEAAPQPAPQETVMPVTPTVPQVRPLDIARWCAARSWHVLPLRAGGKQPAWHRVGDCPGTGDCQARHVTWEQHATADPAPMPWLFGRSTLDAPLNVGIATGPSELVVIDLDVPKPGDQPPPE